MGDRGRSWASPITFAEFQSTRYFPQLDGLRALSVLLVATFHEKGHHFRFLQGEHGVNVFFVLSGFIITTLALREQATGRFSLRAFYLRRTFRILPMYLVALATYTVLILVFHLDPRSKQFVATLPYFLLYFQEITLLRVGTPFSQAWSLGIEEKFYVVWPLLAFRLMTRSRPRLWLIAIVVACLAVLPGNTVMGTYLKPYLNILVGCGLAVILHDERRLAWFRGTAKPAVAAAAIITVIGVNLAASPFTRTTGVSNAYGLVLSLSIALLLVYVLLLPGFFRPLSQRPLVHLGKLSYGFYLFHQLGFDVANKAIPFDGLGADLAVFVLGLVITVVVCEVLHRLLEVPMISLGRRFSDASRRRDGRSRWRTVRRPLP
jgi:peptidoglycan/LPS O-acetylase OafA/YrhL